MASRHLQGTVFSRVRALLASGTLKEKPVWFDVMEAFPALVETKVNDVAPDGRPPVVSYKEDEIREMFTARFPLLRKIPVDLTRETSHKKPGFSFKTGTALEAKTAGLPTINSLVEKFKDNLQQSGDQETAIQQTINWVIQEEQSGKLKLSWAKQVEKLKEKENDDSRDSIDIMDLFNLKKSNNDK